LAEKEKICRLNSSAALPLNIIRQRARIRVASYGGTATNLYVQDAIYRGGEVLQPKRADIVVPRDSVIVFADDEPTKNWGHRCRYLFHDPKTGELIQELPALLPPTFDFGARFELFQQASTVSAASRSQYPLLYLPPWLYLESASSWYAILYSGASMNRHVNDIEFLYRILVNLYRVPAANITVLSFDGTLDYNDAFWQKVPPPVGNWPGDNTPYQMKINGSGTKEELLAAIAAVGEKLGPHDNLFLHTNNHGNTVNGVSTLISYSGDDTTQSDLSDAIQALPKFASFMVMMEQCFSGGFIQPIINASPASCTSVATAVDANTSSNGGPDTILSRSLGSPQWPGPTRTALLSALRPIQMWTTAYRQQRRLCMPRRTTLARTTILSTLRTLRVVGQPTSGDSGGPSSYRRCTDTCFPGKSCRIRRRSKWRSLPSSWGSSSSRNRSVKLSRRRSRTNATVSRKSCARRCPKGKPEGHRIGER
jgi:Peptidase C13 family.